MVATHTQ